jgi:predicted phage-related endonuclease
MITASDFAAILGEDPHKSAIDVYADKVTERKEVEVIGIDDPRFWGHELEQPVLQAAARFYGWDYQRCGWLLRSRKHPFIGATLDGEVDRHDGLGWIPNECKNSEIHRNWNEDEQGCPVHVVIQCQVQLLVTGAPVDLCFALLSRYRPVRIAIEAVESFHAVLVEVGQEFMERLAKLDPPPPTASSARALARLFPLEDGTMVTLPPEAVEWTREIQEIGGQMATLKNRGDELRNMLKLCIGESTFGVLPEPVEGKRAWRWLTQACAGYTVEPTTSRTLLSMKDVALPGQKARPLPATLPEVHVNSLPQSSELIKFKARRARR